MNKSRARKVLQESLNRLAEEDRISSDGRAPVTLQQDSVGRISRMDAMQQQQMALAAEQRRKSERARIAAALVRLDQDEWGCCLTCGEQIAAARLTHDPAASQCIGCAS